MNPPIVALMYDFDKTLSPKDMQEYGFIPELGMSPSEFWGEVNELTDREEMDNTLAYMYLMVEKCREKGIRITKDKFRKLGQGIAYFNGVETWFSRISKTARNMGVCVEHYIVSSGIKEIIEGTSIAHHFRKIYACEFMYDGDGMIKWPKFAVNYTAKTQFLFRINKGVLDIDSRSSELLNRYTPDSDRRIPFRNMVYIGDGLTDVPCMKLVKLNGGQSIVVYDKNQEAARKLVADNRVNFCVPADYSQGSPLETAVTAILCKSF